MAGVSLLEASDSAYMLQLADAISLQFATSEVLIEHIYEPGLSQEQK